MNTLEITLFGRFCVQYDKQVLPGLEAQKAQELLVYLLLHRQRPHYREFLATLLWCDHSMEQAKRYLRKALWQVQAALPLLGAEHSQSILRVNDEWLQVNSAPNLSIDVITFEQAYTASRDVPGPQLSDDHAACLRCAADLYRGDLLEGWYADWCILERERLQYLYLLMLDKLIQYSEAIHDYETGILYGYKVLHFDPAREQTHRQLMRLRYYNGDRTGAIRQYEQCVQFLAAELGVPPSAQTEDLYQLLCSDRLTIPPIVVACQEWGASFTSSITLHDLYQKLEQLQVSINQLHAYLSQEQG